MGPSRRAFHLVYTTLPGLIAIVTEKTTDFYQIWQKYRPLSLDFGQ